MEKNIDNNKNQSTAKRVRQHRTIRRAAGLVELRVWITAAARDEVNKILQPFSQEVIQLLQQFKGDNCDES